MKVTALAGGVGGAKLVNGLSRLLPPEDLSIIVNTGDDFEYLGFYICPDLDTVVYNLAGINNPATGYGLKDDTHAVISGLEELGHEIWFRIGDRDIATQIERTGLLRSGHALTDVVRKIAKKLGVNHQVFPMSDSPVQTLIITEQNETLSFQEYFVKYHWQPVVKKIVFSGCEKSALPSKARANLETSEVVVICPSNPYVSIDPILSVPGVMDSLKDKIVIAVSPLIRGATIKGPAAKIMSELGIQSNSTSIAQHYRDFLAGILIDTRDQHEKDQILGCGIIPYATDIYMPDIDSQKQLAGKVIDFSTHLLEGKQI